MRLQSFLGIPFFLAAALVLPVLSSTESDSTEPEILVSASFPEDNPFGHVVNGEKNTLLLTVENKSDRNATLIGVSASLYNPDTDALLKNLTSLPYNAQLLGGVKTQLAYTFYSEFKPGDLRLTVWLDHAIDDERYRTSAYDSIITVVEPDLSIFDMKMLSTYLIVASILGGVGFALYRNWFPASKKSRSKRDIRQPKVSAPSGTAKATGAARYEEEWIPAHHLLKGKGGKKQPGVASGTSADETSGAETSGAEGKRRKRRK
jgi:hypothetical protein